MEFSAAGAGRRVLPWMVVCLWVAGTLAEFRHLEGGMTEASGKIAAWCSTRVRAVTP